jgi:hypothetical protein
MAENQAAHGEIFVYTRGWAPPRIVRARIDRSVTVIGEEAFSGCRRLKYVEFHDGVEVISENAFMDCHSLQRLIASSVKVIKDGAFRRSGLEEVDLPKVERIETSAFNSCTSLRRITFPSIKTIATYVFFNCTKLTELKMPGGIERIGRNAFKCSALKCISIPLKDGMFQFDGFGRRFNQFDGCENLTTVDIIVDMRKTMAHLESWSNELRDEIQSINRILPNIEAKNKTVVVQQWIRSVVGKIEHYKAEYLKEAMALLELALWKANLDENKEDSLDFKPKKAKIDIGEARQDRRITSGADIVIKNVLPFLKPPTSDNSIKNSRRAAAVRFRDPRTAAQRLATLLNTPLRVRVGNTSSRFRVLSASEAPHNNIG